MFQAMQDIGLLLVLGACGWGIFTLLHFPAPPLLGTIVIIGSLRVMQLPLPFSPGFFAPLTQIILGIFVGAKITRETIKGMKQLVKPAGILVAWALSLVFVLGMMLYYLTDLDLYTALLSSSIGGLPEMVILALDTNADLGIVIIMQTTRMILTSLLFPIIVKYFSQDSNIEDNIPKMQEGKKKNALSLTKLKEHISKSDGHIKNINDLIVSVGGMIPTFIIAITGGLLFIRLGVPAGGMIGAMFFIVAASMSGMHIKPPSSFASQALLVGVGVTVADNISQETIEIITSGKVVLPLVIATLAVFSTSFLVTWIIHKTMKWDLGTSFLAAAPGGFTVMSTLALKYGKDPFRVSMLHLCRLLSLKIAVPFAFMALF